MRARVRRALLALAAVGGLAAAGGLPGPAAAAPIRGAADPRLAAAQDVVAAEIRLMPAWALFRIELRGPLVTPRAARAPRAARVPETDIVAYVWPTSIEPSTVGFDRASGTLALAVMAHPGFDDTPLFDENADGNPDDDGATWHVHWLVLVPEDGCGRGALRVRDIPQGADRPRPPLPRTWPGLPLLIDSPGYSARVAGSTIEVRVPFADLPALRGASFDAFTATLRLAAPGTVPLLCVSAPLDSASGNLGMPGRIE